MTFLEVIPALLEGKTIRRAPWADSGGFLALDPDIQGWFLCGNDGGVQIVETIPLIHGDLTATDWEVLAA